MITIISPLATAFVILSRLLETYLTRRQVAVLFVYLHKSYRRGRAASSWGVMPTGNYLAAYLLWWYLLTYLTLVVLYGA